MLNYIWSKIHYKTVISEKPLLQYPSGYNVYIVWVVNKDLQYRMSFGDILWCWSGKRVYGVKEVRGEIIIDHGAACRVRREARCSVVDGNQYRPEVYE